MESSQVINGRKVSVRQLEALLAVQEEGSQTSAARRLGISTGLVRLVTLVAFCCTGFFPVGLIYCLLALILPAGPEYC